jgi:hypothetical protein
VALKNVAFNIRADGAETVNSQATLITAGSDAITAAVTANASNDATTEIAAIQTALDAVSANQPTGAVVVTIDTSLVTTKNQLRVLLDAAYRHFAQAQDILA